MRGLLKRTVNGALYRTGSEGRGGGVFNEEKRIVIGYKEVNRQAAIKNGWAVERRVVFLYPEETR